jgi:hypothetical protein
MARRDWTYPTGSLHVFRPQYAAQTIHVVRRASRGVDDAGLVLLLEAARACPSLIELVLHRNAIADTGAVALAAHVRGWPGLVDVDLGCNAVGDRRAAQHGFGHAEPRGEHVCRAAELSVLLHVGKQQGCRAAGGRTRCHGGKGGHGKGSGWV